MPRTDPRALPSPLRPPSPAWRWLSLSLALVLAALGSGAAWAGGRGVWSWTGGPPEGAVASAIAADPSDPGVVYTATYTSGVYKTANGGQGWAPFNRGLAVAAFTSIVVNPHDPKEVFLVAAGGSQGASFYLSTDGGANWVAQPRGMVPAVFDARDGSMFAFSGASLYGSIDGGFTWDLVGGIPDGAPISSLARDTADPGVFYASSYQALYKSIDRGANFTRHSTPIAFGETSAPTTVLTDAAVSGTVYVATFRGIWKSTDSGASWSLASRGLRGLRNHNRVVSRLIATPSSPAVLYAVLTEVLSTRPDLYRSGDGGATWVDQGFLGTDGRTFRTLAASTADTLYASDLVGSPGVFKSADGGRSWTVASSGMAGPVKDVTFQSGARGGLYALGTFSTWKSTDGGVTWKDLKRGLDALQVDPANPDRLDAIQNGGFTTSVDGGRNWSQVQFPPSCLVLTKIVVAPLPRPTIYALTDTTQRFCQSNPGLSSTDSGRSWHEIPELAGIVDLVLDPADLSTLYAARYSQGDIIRSRDGGRSWTVVGPSPATTNGGRSLRLAIGPRSGELYLTLSDAAIFTSRDRAHSWQPAGPLPLPPFTPATVVPDPHVAGRVYAVGPKALFLSDDGGKSWASPARGLTRSVFVQTVTVSPDGTLFVASNNGVFSLAPAPD